AYASGCKDVARTGRRRPRRLQDRHARSHLP
ncbi:MAG: hypothetical protein AVDCRST_MAG13-1380, partial [uncultured Solirubrobacteraceae bacterium]